MAGRRGHPQWEIKFTHNGKAVTQTYAAHDADKVRHVVAKRYPGAVVQSVNKTREGDPQPTDWPRFRW